MNFNNNITDKYGVIVKHWPLKVFCTPGDICTVTELRVFIQWESCTAHFYRMTMAEATKWSNERHSTSSLSPSESGSRDTAVNTSKQDLSDQNNTIPTDGATVNTSEQDLSD